MNATRLSAAAIGLAGLLLTSIASADGVALSRPRRLFAHPVAPDAHGPEGFDVAADGRFLVIEREPVPRERTATVVLNWLPRAGP